MFLFEGEFYQRPKETLAPGEKAKPIRQEDNLHMEGEFVQRERSEIWRKGERAERVIHEDNIRMEGQFDSSTTSQLDYKSFRGERYDIVRREDMLRMEGDFNSVTTNEANYQQKYVGERAEVRKPKDNLQPEGECT